MPSGALSSFGTFLQMGDGATPENFTTIAEVLDIDGPDIKAETEDVTNHSSTGGWREKIATVLDGGDVTFDLNFLPTNPTQGNTTGLLGALKARSRKNFRMLLTDATPTKWQFAALVSGFKPSGPVVGASRASVTLTVTGEPVLV